MVPTPVPETPMHQRGAEIVAAEIATRFVDRAADACVRLRDTADVEALHDFRVGVRRLRTFLQAYDDYLDVDRGLRARLRKITRRTNALRDAEVGLKWLAARRSELTTRERIGSAWLARRMELAKAEGYIDIRAEMPLRWIKLERKLRKQLARPISARAATTYGQASATLVLACRRRMKQRLGQIATIEDEEPAHSARIAAKRLRYLLEPFRSELPNARALVREIRKLQEVFGDLNDSHVMMERLREEACLAATENTRKVFELCVEPGADATRIRAVRQRNEQAGLLRLAQLAAERRVARFSDAWERYCEGRVTGTLDRVDELIDELRRGAAPTRDEPRPADEATDPAPPLDGTTES